MGAMNLEIDRHVVKAIADVVIFLEFSGEEAVNPDDAVQAMEHLAATLQEASEEVRSSLCSGFKSLSSEYSGDRAEFLESLGAALGLE